MWLGTAPFAEPFANTRSAINHSSNQRPLPTSHQRHRQQHACRKHLPAPSSIRPTMVGFRIWPAAGCGAPRRWSRTPLIGRIRRTGSPRRIPPAMFGAGGQGASAELLIVEIICLQVYAPGMCVESFQMLKKLGLLWEIKIYVELIFLICFLRSGIYFRKFCAAAI